MEKQYPIISAGQLPAIIPPGSGVNNRIVSHHLNWYPEGDIYVNKDLTRIICAEYEHFKVYDFETSVLLHSPQGRVRGFHEESNTLIVKHGYYNNDENMLIGYDTDELSKRWEMSLDDQVHFFKILLSPDQSRFVFKNGKYRGLYESVQGSPIRIFQNNLLQLKGEERPLLTNEGHIVRIYYDVFYKESKLEIWDAQAELIIDQFSLSLPGRYLFKIDSANTEYVAIYGPCVGDEQWIIDRRNGRCVFKIPKHEEHENYEINLDGKVVYHEVQYEKYSHLILIRFDTGDEIMRINIQRKAIYGGIDIKFCENGNTLLVKIEDSDTSMYTYRLYSTMTGKQLEEHTSCYRDWRPCRSHLTEHHSTVERIWVYDGDAGCNRYVNHKKIFDPDQVSLAEIGTPAFTLNWGLFYAQGSCIVRWELGKYCFRTFTNQQVLQWDLNTGYSDHIDNDGDIISLLPDGNYMTNSMIAHKFFLMLHDGSTGQELQRSEYGRLFDLEDYSNRVVLFSGNGSRFAVIANTNEKSKNWHTAVFDVSTGSVVSMVEGHAWNLDFYGKLLINSDENILDASDLSKTLGRLPVPKEAETYSSVFGKRRHIVAYRNNPTGEKDGVIEIWRYKPGVQSLLNVIPIPKELGEFEMEFLAQDRYLLVSSEDSFLIWETEKWKMKYEYLRPVYYNPLKHRHQITTDSEGRYLILSRSGAIEFRDIATFEILITLYTLEKGYLWVVPPCGEMFPNEMILTDRPELLCVYECDKDGNKRIPIPIGDERRKKYLDSIIVHDPFLVLGRITSPVEWKKRITSIKTPTQSSLAEHALRQLTTGHTSSGSSFV